MVLALAGDSTITKFPACVLYGFSEMRKPKHEYLGFAFRAVDPLFDQGIGDVDLDRGILLGQRPVRGRHTLHHAVILGVEAVCLGPMYIVLVLILSAISSHGAFSPSSSTASW